MKSLDQITIAKVRPIKKKGPNGVIRTENTKVYYPLKVKTIHWGLRLVHPIVDIAFVMLLAKLFALLPFLTADIKKLSGLSIFVLYPLLNMLMEFFFQQTPGKFITRTVVINRFADKPNLAECILRMVLRFIPFEAFTCLSSESRGWHDKWSHTYVVKKEDAQKLKSIVEEHNSPANTPQFT